MVENKKARHLGANGKNQNKRGILGQNPGVYCQNPAKKKKSKQNKNARHFGATGKDQNKRGILGQIPAPKKLLGRYVCLYITKVFLVCVQATCMAQDCHNHLLFG